MSQRRWIPKPVRRARSALWHAAGRDDLYYLNLAPRDQARRVLQALPAIATTKEVHYVDPSAGIRVVIHLHYGELWSEIAAMLGTVRGFWGLFVTLTPSAAGLEGDICKAFPGAVVRKVENRGRDIGPFFELLRSGALDGARAVCKLHGKRSLSDGRPALTGEVWRRSAFSVLLGRTTDVYRLFGERPDVGAAGPAHLLLPSRRFAERKAWRAVEPLFDALSHRIGLDAPALEFFAGSMLWLSAPALAKLKQLDLGQADFEDEANYSEPSFAHAAERIFLPAVRAAGLSVGVIPANGGPIRIVSAPLRRRVRP